MSLFKRYIPADIDEASARFYALNPLEVPSGLLSEGHLERISKLPKEERKAYWWFQQLADQNYKNQRLVFSAQAA
jgi:hypothetical protein